MIMILMMMFHVLVLVTMIMKTMTNEGIILFLSTLNAEFQDIIATRNGNLKKKTLKTCLTFRFRIPNHVEIFPV